MDILGRKESKSAKRFGVTKETALVHPAVLRTSDEIFKWLEENKHLLNYPEATLGDEPGSFHKDWESPSFKLCLVAWNGYTQLMGSLTLPMLYRMLNEAYPSGICERAFFPNDPKEMAIYEKNGLPIFSVESKHSIADFDVVGFSVAVTGMDLNVIKMLAMSGIPVRAKDRPLGKYPLIVRGGVSSGNLSPIGAFYDVCFVGEAEAGFVEILNHIRVLCERPVEKKDLLLELANSHDGIYIPAFYKEQFDPETKRLTGWKVMSGAPKEVKRAYIKDVNKAYVYKNPVIHYSGSMGLGELLISRSCANSCNFCNESLVTKPYREYEPDVVVDALKTNMAESGSDGVLPAGFCLSTHSQRTTIIKRLYEEVSDDVKLISQRVDDFASDPGFVTLSRKAGNMGVSLGVEGLSDRLRRLVNKNITTQQIIDASVNAMTAGYSKIKYFMLAGLPGETQEDRDEFLLLAERIAAEREKLGSKCRLQFNWTTLSIVDHSPFQWFKPNIETRTLHAILHRLKELGIRAGFGASKTPDSDFYGQLMFIGDSRLSSIIEDLTFKFGCVYFRGIKKGTKDFIVSQLSEMGLSEELWFREKGEDELFPWDIIDFGIKKSFLLKRYRECKEGICWAPCKVQCSGCGACDKEDQKYMQTILSNEDTHLTSKEALSIVPVRQKGTVQRYLFRIVQEKSHRYLSVVVKRMIIRRALYQCGLPTTKDIGISSATPPLEAWIYGVDYVDIPFHLHSYGMLDRIKEVDRYLVGMRLDRTLRLPPSAGAIRSNFDSCLYSLRANVSISELRERVQMLLDASPITDNLEEVPGKQRTAFIRDHIGAVRVKVPANRGGVDQMLVDVRPMVRNLLVVEQEGGIQLLAELTGFINIYHVYRAMTNRPWREILGMDGFRLEFFASSMSDLFSRKCSVCKALIRKNLFDEFYGMCVVCGNPVQ